MKLLDDDNVYRGVSLEKAGHTIVSFFNQRNCTMTHRLVTAILLAESVILAGTAQAELIKEVKVSIVTKPADIDDIRKEALKATVDAQEAVEQAEEQLWRARLSRRPDRQTLLNQAKKAKRLAEDHRKKLRTQMAVEGLHQAAIITCVVTEPLANLKNATHGNDPDEKSSRAAEPGPALRAILEVAWYVVTKSLAKLKNATHGSDLDEELNHAASAGLASRTDLAHRNAVKEAWHKTKNACSSVENAYGQLNEIKSMEQGGIVEPRLVVELQQYVEPLRGALGHLEDSMGHVIRSGAEKKTDDLDKSAKEAGRQASILEKYLETVSGSIPHSEPHFRIEILYGNRICGNAGFRDEHHSYELKDGEKLHVFQIALGRDGIRESTSDKAKLRIIKMYSREPPEIGWGIWDIKDVLVTGYLAQDAKPTTQSHRGAINGAKAIRLDFGVSGRFTLGNGGVREDVLGSVKAKERRGSSQRNILVEMCEMAWRWIFQEEHEASTRVELLPLTLVDNYDASVLFAGEAEERHGFPPPLRPENDSLPRPIPLITRVKRSGHLESQREYTGSSTNGGFRTLLISECS